MFCPNFSNKDVKREFDELTSAVGEPLAYYLWNQNQGYPLTKTSTGKDSKLYNDLVELTGNRIDAMKIKAKTFTDSFKEWFGNSKVVDENGEPLIVYHGSRQGYNIEIFKFVNVEKLAINAKSEDNTGIFFTDDIYIAATYGDGTYKNTHPVFLSITNPATPNKETVTSGSVMKYINKNDGVIGLEPDHPGTNYVVFQPEQIKSIFNQGTYDVTNPNIYDNTEGLKKISVENPMDTMLDNFAELFPDIAFYTPQQQQVFANLVQEGHLRMDC